MDKKATVILLSASIAFFVAGTMIINSTKMPATLGENQISLSKLYGEDQVYLSYFEIAAKFALAEAMNQKYESKDFYTLCRNQDPMCSKINENFKNNLKKHIDSFDIKYKQSLTVSGYTVEAETYNLGGKNMIELVAVSKERISVNKYGNMTYKVNPSFRIKADLEELNKMSLTQDAVAVKVLEKLASKFNECKLSFNAGKRNCYCDRSDVILSELPEGYKIILSSETPKVELAGRPSYKFQLWNSEGTKVISSRDEPEERESKGVILGAYEVFSQERDDEEICYPGGLSNMQGYIFSGQSPKGNLYIYFGPSNCEGSANFAMVEFVKESEDIKPKGPLCSEING